MNVPSQNILIQNCSMRAGHGGIVLGSEISGGVIDHIRYENIQVGRVQDAIVVNFYYEEGEAGPSCLR